MGGQYGISRFIDDTYYVLYGTSVRSVTLWYYDTTVTYCVFGARLGCVLCVLLVLVINLVGENGC